MLDTVTIETTSLGDRSYLVTDGEVAAVIDPQRDIDRVQAVADERGVTVTHVFETHVHNDYVTGGYQLARSTGATYHLPLDDEVDFDRNGLADGDVVEVGSFEVRAVSTPGHTPTHLSYVVRAEGRDVAVFTGGSMLYGTVGRTDLISHAMAEQLTRQQHRSVRTLAAVLADDVAVMPTHGFGSFCSSAAVDAGESSTIGDERTQNLALTLTDEDDFVERLLGGLDAYPRYYAHMSPRNRQGPAPIDLSPPVPAGPAEIRARIRAREWIVDLRDRDVYAADFLRGTINIGLADSFSTYVGWLVPWNTLVTLVGDTPEDIAAAQRQLARIGIDRPAAANGDGIDAYAEDGTRGSYRVVDFHGVQHAFDGPDRPTVLDVRRKDEWTESRIDGAVHLPLHELERHTADVPDGEVWVHCASGYRASIAASLLARAGRTPVLIDDDYDRATDLGLTKTK